MQILQIEQRNMAYRLEDQENRNRRKNLRIRGLSELMQGEDLTEMMKTTLNPL